MMVQTWRASPSFGIRRGLGHPRDDRSETCQVGGLINSVNLNASWDGCVRIGRWSVISVREGNRGGSVGRGVHPQ